MLTLSFIDPNMPPVGIALVIAFLVLSLGFHEAAHAWVALKCGDPTGRDLGRITLNPLPHIDPFLTIILPTVLYLTTGFIFGGAKPVPVNFHGLRKPWRDMALVAIAGPATNFLLAIVFWVALHALVNVFGVWPKDSLGASVLSQSVFLNLLLTVFNLLPIPPLDGSRVVAWLMPKALRAGYVGLERVGILLVIGFIFFVPGTQRLLMKGMEGLNEVVFTIATLGGAW